MVVEVIAVGTELLLGQIINTNLATIGAGLAESGLDSYRQTVVGDNRERLAAAIEEALTRADAVLITGGLGPTQDDLTREALCLATGLDLVTDAEYVEHLRRWWAGRGRQMPETNLKQAQHPAGAKLIPNAKGTAPGLDLEYEGKRIFVMPGVPAEMVPMLEEHVLPELIAGAGERAVLRSRLIRSYGLSESRVAELLADLYASSTNPTVAFLASAGEIKIRLTSKAIDQNAAEALIAPLERIVRERLGDHVFGIDSDTVEQVIFRALGERGWTFATAESATGGMIAARVTAVPGASKYFRGAVVAYSNHAKKALLGVDEDLLEVGVVSEATAKAMARGACTSLDADVGVAVTGSAGPDPQEQPVGTMMIAVVTPTAAHVRTLRLPGDRERVRTYTTTAALHMVREALAEEP